MREHWIYANKRGASNKEYVTRWQKSQNYVARRPKWQIAEAMNRIKTKKTKILYTLGKRGIEKRGLRKDFQRDEPKKYFIRWLPVTGILSTRWIIPKFINLSKKGKSPKPWRKEKKMSHVDESGNSTRYESNKNKWTHKTSSTMWHTRTVRPWRPP
jgi:hypothetical protein